MHIINKINKIKLITLIVMGSFNISSLSAADAGAPRTPERGLAALTISSAADDTEMGSVPVTGRSVRTDVPVPLSAIGDGSGFRSPTSPIRKRHFSLASPTAIGEFASPSRKLARQSAELTALEMARAATEAIAKDADISPARRSYSAAYVAGVENILDEAQVLVTSSARHQDGTPLRRIRETAAVLAANAAGLMAESALDDGGHFKPVVSPERIERATKVLKTNDSRRKIFNLAHSLKLPTGAAVTMRPGEYPRLVNLSHAAERHAAGAGADAGKKTKKAATKVDGKFATQFNCPAADIPKILSTAEEVATRVDTGSGALKKTMRLPDGFLGVAVSYAEPLYATFYPLTREPETVITNVDLERGTVKSIGVDQQAKAIRVASRDLLDMAKTAIGRRHGTHGSHKEQDPIIGVIRDPAGHEREVLVDIHGELGYNKKLTKIDKLVFSGESKVVRVPVELLELTPAFVASLSARTS